MTRFIIKKSNWSKVVAVALAGASLSAPAFMATSAQAASAGYSQVQYRDRYDDDRYDDDRYEDRRDRRERNRNRRNRRDRNREARTVDAYGTVRDLSRREGGDRRTAVLETDNGRTIRFTTDNRNIRRGSRIRIRGEMHDGVVVQPHID